MYPSVRIFMEKLIDYAGLFPPAGLPINEAIRNYQVYSRDQDNWMLGKFVIPVSRLQELAPYMPSFSQDHPLRLSVIGDRSSDVDSCKELLGKSLEKIQSFGDHFQAVSQIAVLDLPLPPIPLQAHLMEEVGSGTSRHGLQTFCELTYVLNKDWESNMFAALDEIAAYNEVSGLHLGIKLRTGGITAEAFPTAKQVALVLAECRDRDLPLKFTAGLHHPVRMYGNEVKTKMHGFLNVFFAGLLAHSYKLGIPHIAEILEDELPESFKFTSDGLQWRQLTMSSSEIQAYRNERVCSYGCCSFDEPRDEMRDLQLLEQRS
ncbi:hypothetical protein [Paenibacillus aceris]|uniref:Uncharacterized protein n=1 Tax=Paenibacillus aceris TaxID=869555 RepID=A0ABS4I002_9BACL|nr:hypothetical protein [Paenibacillus aceris]MBP1964246.1 hypothetical protein [Paenibacillus aceris]NHW36569.1 hypothetical protein [Paenibacillus aceris]